MPAVVLNVDYQLITNLPSMLTVADAFQLDYKLVLRQEEVHSSAGACVTRRELFRSDVRDPRPQLRMQ